MSRQHVSTHFGGFYRIIEYSESVDVGWYCHRECGFEFAVGAWSFFARFDRVEVHTSGQKLSGVSSGFICGEMSTPMTCLFDQF